MYQISRIELPGGRHTLLEDEHRVDRLLAWLPAGPVLDAETGEEVGVREHDLVQFRAREGGRRTVRTDDLTLL